MAFLPQDQQDTTQQGQQQNQVPAVPQIPTLQGTSGPTASSSSGTGSTNTASAPGAAPSAPWQNISSYLNANAGQAGNVADTIAGNLQSQYNTANQGIQQAQQNFGQQIESARVPLNSDVATRAAQTPGQFVQNPNDVAAFQKMFNASYGGPQDFSHTQDYSDLQGKVLAAQKQASLVNQGTPGLMTLLQQAEGANGANPTQGVTALDSLLLQEDPNNFTKVSDAAKPFGSLTDYLSSTQQGLDTAAQNAAKEAAATQSSLQNQFLGQGGVAPSFQNKLNQELQGAVGKAKDYNQTIADTIAALAAGQPLQNTYPNWVQSNIDPSGTLQALNPYGTGGGIFQNMLGNGFPGVAPGMLAQFYNAPKQLNTPGLENVMTPQELADAQALNQLLGQSAVAAPTQLGQQFQVPQGYGSFDSKAATQALYDTLMNDQSALPQMNDLQLDSYLNDIHTLGSWLGMPNTAYPNPAPPPATPPPAPGTGPGLGDGGGPPYLAPPGGPGGTVPSPGGGRHTF